MEGAQSAGKPRHLKGNSREQNTCCSEKISGKKCFRLEKNSLLGLGIKQQMMSETFQTDVLLIVKMIGVAS